MSVFLRPTTKGDLPFVIKIEQNAAGDRFVTSQGLEQHESYVLDDDIRHYIVEDQGRRVGYVILAGLNDANETIEFRRMVIAEKGKGYGRLALRMLKKIVFEDLAAHRLWLDVKDFNQTARSLYESEDFVVEGTWREHLKTDNGRESIVFMSILRSEYLSK